MLELQVLFIMSIIMFGTAAGILYLGLRKGTYNILLWALFPLVRGIHQFIEFIADYNEMVLGKEYFFYDRMEMFTGFCATFVLLAACLEFNEMIKKPYGKLIVLFIALIPLYYLLTVGNADLEKWEDQIFFEGFFATSDPPRFLYGFVVPLISALVIVGAYVHYQYQVKKEKIAHNPKILRTTVIIVVLILLFSFFEGFDYEEQELIINLFRAISLSLFIIIPLIIIFTEDLGLQRFFIIEESGLPIFIYNFQTKEPVSSEDLSFLVSGFLTAILNFSDEISTEKGGFLSIRSQYLYYSLLKTEGKIYALQSIIFTKKLESAFFDAVKEIDIFTAEMENKMIKSHIQFKKIIDKNFLTFY